jgi:hypothetical protein
VISLSGLLKQVALLSNITEVNIGGAVEMSVNKSYLHISRVNLLTGNMLYFILLCIMPANFTVLLVEKIALQHFPICHVSPAQGIHYWGRVRVKAI